MHVPPPPLSRPHMNKDGPVRDESGRETKQRRDGARDAEISRQRLYNSALANYDRATDLKIFALCAAQLSPKQLGFSHQRDVFMLDDWPVKWARLLGRLRLPDGAVEGGGPPWFGFVLEDAVGAGSVEVWLDPRSATDREWVLMNVPSPDGDGCYYSVTGALLPTTLAGEDGMEGVEADGSDPLPPPARPSPRPHLAVELNRGGSLRRVTDYNELTLHIAAVIADRQTRIDLAHGRSCQMAVAAAPRPAPAASAGGTPMSVKEIQAARVAARARLRERAAAHGHRPTGAAAAPVEGDRGNPGDRQIHAQRERDVGVAASTVPPSPPPPSGKPVRKLRKRTASSSSLFSSSSQSSSSRHGARSTSSGSFHARENSFNRRGTPDDPDREMFTHLTRIRGASEQDFPPSTLEIIRASLNSAT